MSFALFKNTVKRNWRLTLIFLLVLAFYLGVIIGLIDPDDMQKVKDLYGAAEGFLPAFGMSLEAMTNPLSYTASTFFGLLVMGFSMVYYIILSNKLVARSVDNNSLAYILSLPISRRKFMITQISYLLSSVGVLFIGILFTGSVMLGTMGGFDFARYLNLVAITFLLNCTMALLSFFLSVTFCETKKGFALSSGVPIGLLLLSMLGGAGGEKTKILTKISPFGWIDSVGIVNGLSIWWMYLVLILLSAALIFLSIFIFERKRLPL